MKRIWPFVTVIAAASCQSGPAGDDAPAPAASNIPRASPNATGAMYPPPTALPPGMNPTGGGATPQPNIHDPFRRPTRNPPAPIHLGTGGGTHL